MQHTPASRHGPPAGARPPLGNWTCSPSRPVRRLVLDSRATQLEVSCVTKQGIPVHVRGMVIYKIGDDFASIANAARRFLDQQAQMDDLNRKATELDMYSRMGRGSVFVATIWPGAPPRQWSAGMRRSMGCRWVS